MTTRSSTILAATLLAALLTACGGGQTAETAAAGEAETVPAPAPERTLAIPSAAGDTTTGKGPLVWDLPEGWSEVTPSSTMRLAQYEVPGPAGNGECVVFYFGPGQGGDPLANAQRWAGQFTQPDGSDSLERMKLEELGGPMQLKLVEVTGIYDGGMSMGTAPPERMEGWMLLGGIVEGPDAPWFFKFTGPEETVRAQRDAFIALLRSVRHEA